MKYICCIGQRNTRNNANLYLGAPLEASIAIWRVSNWRPLADVDFGDRGRFKK